VSPGLTPHQRQERIPLQADGTPTTTSVLRRETDEHKYARQSRNANVFVAWVVGVFVLLSLIGSIYVGVMIGNAVNSFNNLGGTTSSNCYSQGGTDVTC